MKLLNLFSLTLCFFLASQIAQAQPWSYNLPNEIYANPIYLKVGIGITNPSDSYRLHVYGGDSSHGSAVNGIYAQADGSFTAIYARTSSGKGLNAYSSSGQAVYGNSYSGTGVYGKSTTGYGVYGSSGSNGWAGFFSGDTHVTKKLAVGTQNRPTNVGGADVSAYHLFVEGGILTDQMRVRTGWADYVFAADYKLLPLSEVEQFIDNNGHLPNVPAAQTVETEGLELGDITRIQQEKIEELFLYLIQMEDHIETLEAELEALKAAK